MLFGQEISVVVQDGTVIRVYLQGFVVRAVSSFIISHGVGDITFVSVCGCKVFLISCRFRHFCEHCALAEHCVIVSGDGNHVEFQKVSLHIGRVYLYALEYNLLQCLAPHPIEFGIHVFHDGFQIGCLGIYVHVFVFHQFGKFCEHCLSF